MNLSTILNAVTVMNTGYKIGLDFLGEFARIIIEGVGIIGLGIVVFTLVLKAITLPFDIYQRFKMRKQTLIMRNMQDDLDKLQKQYANDKAMYNQKMMELQKKNGYSLLGACLPIIVSLVILIVAFQGFRAYAELGNLQTFERMSAAYNEAVFAYTVDGEDFRAPLEGVEDDELTRSFVNGDTWTKDGVKYTFFLGDPAQYSEVDEGKQYLRVEAEDDAKYLYYIYNYEVTRVNRIYYVNEERFAAQLSGADKEAYEGAENKTSFCNGYIEDIGAQAAAEYFRNDGPHFLWIGNVWYPDVSYEHPVPAWKTITGQIGSVELPSGEHDDLRNVLTEDDYNKLVARLSDEQTAANGYFILIILSVGLMVVSQLISMKSNKESNKYQTVDGRGATTQKVMLVAMPLIYGMFAFLMSAAFSIYMIVSSVVSILVMLLSNLIIGHVFNKKEEKKFKEEHTRTLPWMSGGYSRRGSGDGKNSQKDAKKEKKKK